MPQLASMKIKRWALLLAAYNYTIECITGKENIFADFLSRKPLKAESSPEEHVDVQVLFIDEQRVISSGMVHMKTKKDQNFKSSSVLY